MKDFFKSLFASILGCSIVFGLFFIIMFIFLAAISFSSEETFSLKKNTILTLKLDGQLKERTTPNPFSALMGMDDVPEMGLDDILISIQKAKENDKIKGIYIQANAFAAPSASLKEIRDELVDFKKSGKFIVAYADIYTQGCYYIASVADKVIVNPQGHLDLHGMAATPAFYKGLLDKLGIEMQIFKVGTFKSAVEPFILDKMSDANREQVSSFINDMWATMVDDISDSRRISVADLNLYADSIAFFMKQDMYVTNKLVDTLMYETDVKKYLATLVEAKDVKDLRLASVKNMASVPFLENGDSKNVVAILYAEGDITSGSGTDGITDKRYVKEIEKLKNDDKVKAVVFRINSGGGSAYASEQIWKAVGELKEKKPVVVSMGDYAASGGYYIGCNASKIIANPNTLTGSIGIFGMFPNVEGLTQKIGLNFDNVKTNANADFGNISRPMREDEKVVLQNYVERGYDLFLTRCAEGRGISKDSLDMIAQGRVWTGNQALKLRLVDAIGGINTAIDEAVKLAALEKYSLKGYPRKVDFMEAFFSNQKEELATKMLKEHLGSDYNAFQTIRNIKNQDYIQARMPYDLVIE